jgi:hypothetical protein
MDTKDARIVPDMGVRVSFLEEAAKDGAPVPPPKGVLVPSSGIVDRGGKSVVFVIDGDRARLHGVAPGQQMGDLRLVEGLASGVRIVRAPPKEMSDGARITMKNASR